MNLNRASPWTQAWLLTWGCQSQCKVECDESLIFFYKTKSIMRLCWYEISTLLHATSWPGVVSFVEECKSSWLGV
jgi:hypothetical protein